MAQLVGEEMEFGQGWNSPSHTSGISFSNDHLQKVRISNGQISDPHCLLQSTFQELKIKQIYFSVRRGSSVRARESR